MLERQRGTVLISGATMSLRGGPKFACMAPIKAGNVCIPRIQATSIEGSNLGLPVNPELEMTGYLSRMIAGRLGYSMLLVHSP